MQSHSRTVVVRGLGGASIVRIRDLGSNPGAAPCFHNGAVRRGSAAVYP